MSVFKNKDADNKKASSSTAKDENSKKANSSKKKTAKKKSGGAFKYITGLLFAKMARGGTSELRANADEVNKLNVFPVPDGDTGDNMRMTIESGIAAIENLDSDDIAEVLQVFSHGMLLGARGNSGVILSQLFAGMSSALRTEHKADPAHFGEALKRGVEQAYTSVMTPTEGTILTVAREATEYAVGRINEKSTIKTLFADLVKEMNASLKRTPEILAVLKEAGVVDSGGAGLYYIMDGFNRVLNGEELDSARFNDDKSATVANTSTTTPFNADSVMEHGYCTEILLQLQNVKCDPNAFDIEPLKAFLSQIGNSIVCFKTDSVVKVHVHTMLPEQVVEYCHRYGEFLNVKIENMSLQHTEADSDSKNKEENAGQKCTERKKYAIVAVSSGDGISSVFCELGVDEIVNGGQTNNPSTNDFIAAFERINAEHIFLLPNNGNIIMAAEQAADMYDASCVHVIKSKNIGAGYVALTSVNFDAENWLDITADMNSAMERVVTGYLSPSIRDANLNGVKINNGDTIGIIGKEIVSSDESRMLAAKQLVEAILERRDAYMFTVFCGKDADPAERDQLQNVISALNGDAEVYFVDGGQDIYPYIFVAE